MKVFEIEQRSEEWHKLRLGKITGTRLKDLFKADWLTVVDEVLAELITKQTPSIRVNEAMQWGIDNEPLAKLEYEKLNFVEVHELGFCISDEFDFLGLSPDGFVGSDGAIEIKCPSSKTHLTYIRQDKVPSEYKYQICNYFLVNKDLEWLDFVSFDPRNSIYPIFVKRVTREELSADLVAIEKKLHEFKSKLDLLCNKINFNIKEL